MKSCLALVLLFTVAGAAQAESGTDQVRQASEPVDVVASTADAASDKPVMSEEGCIRETGTRIRHRAGRDECRFAGRSYSRDDLKRSGHTDVGSALQHLSPALRGG